MSVSSASTFTFISINLARMSHLALHSAQSRTPAAVIDVRVSRGPSGPSVCRADGTEVLGLGAGSDGRAVRLGGRVWSRADEALAARLAGRWRVPIVANHERVLGALRSGRIERRSTPRAAR